MRAVRAIGLLLFLTPALASADDILAQWHEVAPPAPPLATPVLADPGRTAFLVLDMAGMDDPAKGPCNPARRPRCVATLPAIATMLDAARGAGVLVVYSVSDAGTAADIAPALAPRAGDPVVKSGPDKFVGTDLAALLAARGISMVIITGTAAEGAVLDTATDAILREHLSVVVPVDGISSSSLFAEQYVAWALVHAPGLAGHAVVTRGAMIRY